MNENTSTLHIVLSCIKELTATEKQVAPRQAIIEQTGLSPHIIKERIDELLLSGEIRRVERGVYQSVKLFPPARPISKTALEDGEVILEVGDAVLHLTPAEERMMRSMFGNATVELQQVAAPVVQQQQQQAVAPVIMTLDDIAALFNVSRRVARDKITKDPGFPATVPGSTERKPMWAKATIMEYLCVSA